MKNNLRKDLIREINKNKGRFLSIFFIVMLGTAFFSGIRSSGSDMKLSADSYYKDTKMMDIRVLGTLGLTDDDLDDISKLPSVELAEGGYTKEVIATSGEKPEVMKIIAQTAGVNEPWITEGRIAESGNECVMDASQRSNYKIGDILTIEAGDKEEDLSETLKYNEYEIVGFANLPYYLDLMRGVGSIGNGTITAFVLVPKEAFETDYYTEIYVRVKGADELNCYSDEYEDLAETAADEIDAIASAACVRRYRDLLNEGLIEIGKAEAEVQRGKKELHDARQELDDAAAELADAKVELDDGETALADAKAELDSAATELEDNRTLLETSQSEYDTNKAALDAAWEEYNTNLASLEAMKAVYGAEDPNVLVMQAQLDAAYTGLSENQAALDAAKTELDAGWASLEEGQTAYDDGLTEYEEKYAEYQNGLTEYEDGLAEYEDGEAEYEDAYAENMPKIEDGIKEIWEAKADLADIKKPKWYVLGRDTIVSAVSFGQDGERMDSLGNVFPVIFFLVAALVSLTAMTRMIDEQRQQIGTLKALGFSKASIIGKYMAYALVPTIIGGIIGVLLGERIIPKVIVDAYRMMYTGLDRTLLPLNYEQGILGVAAAILCTGVATFAACNRKLNEKPAQLMRPEAPKSGKRVFLEYIKPVWKRMNFTAKSTVRNLFRYKKRLFMTIIGIGACMGLMMVGFGLHDSITVVAKSQYKEIFKQTASVTVDPGATPAQIRSLHRTIDELEGITDSMDVCDESVTLIKNGYERSARIYVPEETERVFDFLRFQDRVTGEVYEFPEEGVALAEKTADMLGVKTGDTIEIRRGDSEEPVEVKVATIVENYVNHYCFLTGETYEKLFGEKPDYSAIYLKYEDISEENQSRIGEALLAGDACESISFTTDLQDTIDDMLKTLNLVIWVLIIAAGMLAFVVLYNLNNINITERKRELATLKVLGFRDSEVAMYVYRENIWLTLIGIVLGCFVGSILHRFTIVTVEVDLMMFGRSVMPGSYVISAVVTVVFAVIVNAAMYFSLKKIDMIESLKSVE